MLQLLSLIFFVIVPSLVFEVESGLTCLTGETGAGKSILIDALELVLGARSDTSVIREGADRTEVCAEFLGGHRVRKWLANAGLDAADTVLLRRTVDIKGRSRAWVNGTPVTVAQMKELGEKLVDIHGQHAHQSLLKTAYQLQLVDGYGTTRPLRAAVLAAWNIWQEKLRLLTEATQDSETLQTESERLGWINEIFDDITPKQGEWEELNSEHKLLSNGANIVENLRGALEHLREDEENAMRHASLAQNCAQAAARFDPACEEYEKSIAQACALLEDAARDISHHLDKFDFDEERLSEIDSRLSQYWQISRKFHRAPEELYVYREEVKKRLTELEQSADLEGLKAAEQAAKKEFLEKASVLSQARRKAAAELSKAVTDEMQTLSMAGGRLQIELPACDPWVGGLERCEFLVSGHAGATPRPLTKVASGGELARISLAIAVITAQLTPVPTLIFDEVDSGIGGAVAEVVGRLLRRLGRSRQVLCVTHLPQVASYANHQWQVAKHTENGQTSSTLTVLDRKARVHEIARMAGGLQITDATLQTASEMIASAEHTDA